jgi:hypothetical protein
MHAQKKHCAKMEISVNTNRHTAHFQLLCVFQLKETAMDKGIRPACNAKFIELLPQRAQLGNTAFRKAVMDSIMEDFGCSLASAATHYNHAFKIARATHAEQLEGLGRPEDKKGGRKKKEPEQTAPVEGVVTTEQEPVAAAAPVLYTVVKAKDKTVVAAGLTQEQADALIARAAAQKKAKLEIAA